MSLKLLVTVLGIGLIVWVNWNFLFSKKKEIRKRKEEGQAMVWRNHEKDK